jgi:L-phenylalanine/L-methionine N-acetyltransferase
MDSGATIREATPTDASTIVAYLKTLVAEPGICIPLTPDEVVTVEHERAILDDFSKSERALMLVALAEGQLVGELSLKAISQRRSISHVASLGMSVHASWRRKGVGRELLGAALEWAPSAGIKRVELYVYARNEPAIKLYESAGFTHEGRRRGFIRENDAYLDDLVMARWLD